MAYLIIMDQVYLINLLKGASNFDGKDDGPDSLYWFPGVASEIINMFCLLDRDTSF